MHFTTRSQKIAAFIILQHNKAQIRVLLSILLIIFLALLRLHSGESSQKSERSAVHFCAHVHNNPLRTCSPTHLIAADSSHCWRHRSPSSALCCYCISATRFYPAFPPPLLQFRTFLRFFPPPLPISFIRPPRLPLFPLSCPPRSLPQFGVDTAYSRAQKPGKL